MKIFENAEFISCGEDNQFFNFLIEDKGKIIFTGNNIPQEYVNCKKINLQGKCVIPAFGDTHMHFTSFCQFYSGLDCRKANDFESLMDLIQNYIKDHPYEKTIVGFGCCAYLLKENKIPLRLDLDRFTSQPLLLVKYDGHAAVANTAFIKKMPSSIRKHKSFIEDTGEFLQDAFYKVIDYITRSISIIQVFNNIMKGADYLSQKGISLVHTAEGIGFPLDLDIDLMRIAALGLNQKFRIYFQTMDVKKVVKRKLPCIGGCFATALDGCFGSQDAALKNPYTNNQSNNGVLFYPQEEVTKFVKEAHKQNLQISLHAIGDAAIEQALNAYEEALSEIPKKNHRHIIIHGDMINEKLIERAAKLEICIAPQPPFLYWKEEPMAYLKSILGDRADNLMPLKTMLNAGITIASGSDAPCTIPDPIFGIYAACNHRNSKESLSPLEALKMHTLMCSKLSFDESERGSLEVGKLADFVVLDKNILKIPAQEIKNIQIQEVYFKAEKYNSLKNGIFPFMTNMLKSLNLF
ncbi:MAG: amidohydrolase family protein [Desulfobacterales bacterium]|nr:amidohydrolase family protein [Desulfobacterales bacterium]